MRHTHDDLFQSIYETKIKQKSSAFERNKRSTAGGQFKKFAKKRHHTLGTFAPIPLNAGESIRQEMIETLRS